MEKEQALILLGAQLVTSKAKTHIVMHDRTKQVEIANSLRCKLSTAELRSESVIAQLEQNASAKDSLADLYTQSW